MQNKTAFRFFAILLAIACIFHLSFSFVSSRVESKAKKYALENGNDDPILTQKLENDYLDSMKNEVVYRLGFGKFNVGAFTYADVKQREISLGLDLKGGMNVTLEVSIPDLLRAMANNSADSTFNKALQIATQQQNNSQTDFVDLFYNAFKSINPQARLANPSIFGHKGQDLIKVNMTNDEVIAILKKEENTAIDRTFEVLTARIDNFGLTQPNIQKLEGSNRILIELPGVQDPERVQKLLEATAKLEFYETYDIRDIFNNLDRVNKHLSKLAKLNKLGGKTETTVDTTTTAVDETPAINQEVDSTLLAFNNLDSASNDTLNQAAQLSREEFERENPLFAVIQINTFETENGQQSLGQGPVVGYSKISDTSKVNAYFAMNEVKNMLPKDLKLAWENKPLQGGFIALYALKASTRDGKPALEGDVIADASAEANPQGGGFQVTMRMNAEGTRVWAEVTKNNKGKSVAIVLDGKVYSAPNVNDAITGGVSSITGRFTFEDANTLASVLKAGKLSTPAKIVSQAIVGPSLGQKAINAGLTSLVLAFLAILLFMAFYYNKAGIVADIALFANLFFLVGTLAALQTTLTLPGIAGLVLTIGLSVDANILIFERIKEELRHGKALAKAIEDGFKMAYSAIIDANLTTILVAIILILFGAGPVKSFAIILFIGVLTSLFTAIFLSRYIFDWILTRKKSISFSIKMTENVLHDANFNFVKKRKIYYAISTIIVIAGIVSFVSKGFTYGVDLEGGRSYTVVFDNSNFAPSDVAKNLSASLGTDAVVKYYGTTDRVKIVTRYRYDDKSETADKEVEATLFNNLKQYYTSDITEKNFTDKQEQIGIVEAYKVGATVARDVKIKSMWAVVISVIAMALYILVRFKGAQFALGALVSTIHDVVVILAVFSIFDGILPFSLEINQDIIAALLTVVGYSINDTVIIFDRMREYLKDSKKGSMAELINKALNSTLTRTLNTSIALFLVLILSFIFGGEAIRGFSFAMLIGVIVATYSSLFIAAPIVVDTTKDGDKA